jgi:hypothetical protein
MSTSVRPACPPGQMPPRRVPAAPTTRPDAFYRTDRLMASLGEVLCIGVRRRSERRLYFLDRETRLNADTVIPWLGTRRARRSSPRLRAMAVVGAIIRSPDTRPSSLAVSAPFPGDPMSRSSARLRLLSLSQSGAAGAGALLPALPCNGGPDTSEPGLARGGSAAALMATLPDGCRRRHAKPAHRQCRVELRNRVLNRSAGPRRCVTVVTRSEAKGPRRYGGYRGSVWS